jgi:hypothetical protein
MLKSNGLQFLNAEMNVTKTNIEMCGFESGPLKKKALGKILIARL